MNSPEESLKIKTKQFLQRIANIKKGKNMKEDIIYSIVFNSERENLKKFNPITFYAQINPYNGGIMRWTSYSEEMFITDKKTVKDIVRGIRKENSVIEDNFDWVQ